MCLAIMAFAVCWEKECAHEKSPKCLGGNLGDFGEFCKGLGLLSLLSNFKNSEYRKSRYTFPMYRLSLSAQRLILAGQFFFAQWFDVPNIAAVVGDRAVG